MEWRLKYNADEPNPNVPIKDEADRRLEELTASDMEFQEFSVGMAYLSTPGEDLHTNAEEPADQRFTRNSQMNPMNARPMKTWRVRKARIVWTEEAENKLIALWKEKTSGSKNVRRDFNFCQGLAAELEKSGHEKSAIEVKIKMHNLQGKYSEEKRKLGPSTWAHYNKVHAILGGDKEFNLIGEITVEPTMQRDEMAFSANELIPEVAIKKENIWQPEDLRPSPTECYELAVKPESLRSVHAKIAHSDTAPVAYVAPRSPLNPQALECLKAELILEDEVSAAADHAYKDNQVILEKSGDKPGVARIAKNCGKTYERSPRSQPEVFIETQHSQAYCDGSLTRSFRKTDYLRKHIVTHAKDRNGEFICQSCGKSFCSKGNLVKHMRIHAGETFSCEVCGKNYTQKHNLKTHMLRKHTEHKNHFTPSPQTSYDGSGHSEHKQQYTSDPQASFDDPAHAEEDFQSICGPQALFNGSGHSEENLKYSPGHHASFDASARPEDKLQYICGIQTSGDGSARLEDTADSGHSEENFEKTSSQASYDGPVHSDGNLQYFSGPQASCDGSGHSEKHFENTSGPQASYDGPVHCESNLQYTSGPQNWCDGSGQSEKNFKNTSDSQPSYDPSIHSEENLKYTPGPQALYNGPVHPEDNMHYTSVHLTSVEAAVHTKTELLSDEEFLDEVNGAHPAQGSQSVPADKAEFVLHDHRAKVHTDRTYDCRVCGSSFRNNSNRKVHMLRHHFDLEGEGAESAQKSQEATRDTLPEDCVSCKVCYKIYPSELLSTHMRLAHRKPTSDLGLKTFRGPIDIKHHIRTHANDRKRRFACQTCGKTFSRPSTVNIHKTKVHGGKTYGCGMCGAAFKNNANRKEHMLRRHLDEVQQFGRKPQTAKVTSVQTKTNLASDEEFIDEREGPASALGSQQSSSIRMVDDSVSCEVCHNIFPKDLLNTHIRLAHREETHSYKCKQCPRIFTHKSWLKQHLGTHDKNRKREFACVICGSAFYIKGSLATHMKLHAKRTHWCEVCGKPFKTDTGRKEHTLRCHPAEVQQFAPEPQTTNADSLQTKTKLTSDEESLKEIDGAESAQGNQQSVSIILAKESLRCEVCHKIYPKELLSTHIRLAHRERSYKCEICPRSFKTTRNLKQHISTHAKDRKRKFACQMCGKKFLAPSSLCHHRTKVHAGRTYDCQVCGATFRYNSNRKEHMLRQHPGETQIFIPAPEPENSDSVQNKTKSAESAQGSHEDARVSLPEDSVRCEVCHNIYSKELFSTHMRLAHRGRIWKCELCPRIFTHKFKLKQHMSNHEKDRRGNDFYSKTSLAKHVKNIHPDETYNCQVRGSRHTKSKELEAHLLHRHMGESSNLNHQSQSPSNPLADPKTDADFLREDEESNQSTQLDDEQYDTPLKANETCGPSNNVNTKESQQPCKRTWKCELCPRTFRQKSWLMRHLATHDKNRKRRFACQTCGSAFYTKGTLALHMQIHSDETHKCELCGAKYTRMSNLKGHMIRQHPGEAPQIVSEPQTANNTSGQTKTELATDEEFVEEDNRRESSHGSQKNDSISTAEESMSCRVCHNIYPKQLFSTHICLQYRERTWKCELCAQVFTTKSWLGRHMSTHHKERVFYTKNDLVNHVTIHPSGTYNCQVCGSHHMTNEELEAHMLRQHMDEAKQSTPDSEGPTYPIVHQKTDADFLGESVSACTQEGNQSTLQLADEQNIKSNKTSNTNLKLCQWPCIEIFNCEFCSRSFSKIEYLKRHMLTHVKDRKREFRCQSCEKAFYTKGSLVKHIKTHAGETFDCEVCGKNYTQKHNLKFHMRREHSAEKQQDSPGPQTSNEASEHSDYKHQSTSDPLTSFDASIRHENNSINNSRPHTSNEASIPTKAAFMSDGELLGNIDIAAESEVYGSSHTIHPKESKAQEERTFKCELCPRSFLRPENLKRHMCTHTKDDKRKFACHLCESAFSTKRQLGLHMKFHSGNTYNCEVCGYRFTQKHNLKMHILSCKQLQQYHPGPDTSNDGSVHLKTELMSDEETLAQDEAT